MYNRISRVVKKPPASAGDVRDVGSDPGSGSFPGGGHGNPLQHSCLENPMDRGAWEVAVHGVAKSQMTEQLNTAQHNFQRASSSTQKLRVKSLG